MSDEEKQKIVQEIRAEQHIPPAEEDSTLKGYVSEGEFDINEDSGSKINYVTDLKARSLLKNYVLYARYKRLAEFKQLYAGEYANLQAKYYKPSTV